MPDAATATRDHLVRLAQRLDELREHLRSSAADDPRLAAVHPRHRVSALNLLHYLALRTRDVRDLQAELAALGLSSLGRSEAHVLASVDAVRRAVASLAGLPAPRVNDAPVGLAKGDALLEEHADALLGETRDGRRTRIMVTLPPEAADDGGLVHALAVAGAEVFRIRCEYDGPERWAAMIGHVRESEAALGRTLRVAIDLTGPRPRTGKVLPGARVRHVEPSRDALGRVVEPARVWLTTEDGPEDAEAVTVTVKDRAWLARRNPGESIAVRDVRGSRVQLLTIASRPGGLLCTSEEESFIVPGTRLAMGYDVTRVGELPAVERSVAVRPGDDLRLVRDPSPADPDARPARISCVPADVLDLVKVGQRVFFDDGLIGAVVESTTADGLRLWVTEAPTGGSALRSHVHVNLPDTDVALPALTPEDAAHLPFVVRHADAVGLSFVRSSDDVEDLRRHLAELGGEDRGLILKIETPAAFESLPDILLAAMRSPVVGVMIARGDLALEAGYARLGEVQEEILWVCEAAHVPVIWATDVLDDLAQTGRPSRAEITDAAASGRAEAVMLGPGPHAARAVDFLDDLLTRMAEHQHKKSALLRRLRAWDGPLGEPPHPVGAELASEPG